jgi:transposase-like protein
MGKPETPFEIREKAVSMYLETGKMKATAQACGISPPTLYKILYERGVPKKFGRAKYIAEAKRLSDAQSVEVCLAHSTGETAAAIAERYGVSPEVVNKAVRAAGMTPHRRGGKYRFLNSEDEKAIRRMHDDGYSQAQIAAVIGSSQPAVSRFMRAAGMTSRCRRQVGEGHGRWLGGVIKNDQGYLYESVSTSDPMLTMAIRAGYVLQHRLVMARSLGRPLTNTETVHHINGKRDDNRIENLQLRQGKHGKGVRHVCLDCGSHNVSMDKL